MRLGDGGAPLFSKLFFPSSFLFFSFLRIEGWIASCFLWWSWLEGKECEGREREREVFDQSGMKVNTT